MKCPLLITATCAILAATAGAAESDNATPPAATAGGNGPSEEAVIREEKVFDVASGKIKTERVIEFPAAEILPALSRPVTIIIPRQKPGLDRISFTIFNNEPSFLLPDVYRAEYYGRRPVKEADSETAEEFKPKEGDSAAAAEGGENR